MSLTGSLSRLSRKSIKFNNLWTALRDVFFCASEMNLFSRHDWLVLHTILRCFFYQKNGTNPVSDQLYARHANLHFTLKTPNAERSEMGSFHNMPLRSMIDSAQTHSCLALTSWSSM